MCCSRKRPKSISCRQIVYANSLLEKQRVYEVSLKNPEGILCIPQPNLKLYQILICYNKEQRLHLILL